MASAYPYKFITGMPGEWVYGVRCAIVELEEEASSFTQAEPSLCFWVTLSGISTYCFPDANEWYTLSPEETVVLGLPGRTLTTSWRGSSVAMMVEFSRELLSELDIGEIERVEHTVGGFIFVEDSCLVHNVIALGQAMFSPLKITQEGASHMISAILARMRQLLPRESSSMPGGADPRMREALVLQHFILENFGSRTRIADIAAEYDIDVRRIADQYRQLTGLSPYQHLLTLKIDRARALLENGIPISEVAFTLGFCDQSHFTRTFKKVSGYTPTHYRQEHPYGEAERSTIPHA